MTPLLFLSMSVAGGLGGVARFTLDKFISARTSSSTPWGTFFINLSGSLLLGILAGLTIGHSLSPQLQIIIGTGFLGGYTTFSTASCDAVFLVRQSENRIAVAYAFGTLILSTVLAVLGLWLGSSLTGSI